MKQFFITATDTDAGKTFVSCALIKAFTQPLTHHNNHSTNKTLSVAAFKPIAAGCELVDGQLINEDAKRLSEFANCQQSIADINPIAFEQAIAPHIAAKIQNKRLSVAQINDHYQQVKSLNADVILVEGAGGWRLPLGPLPLIANSVNANTHTEINTESNADKIKPAYQFLSDFVKVAELDVILIVNMKLGCLNHALLTYETIKADGLHCIAWIANCAASEPMNNLSENISELEQLLPMPKIAQFDFYSDLDSQGKAITFHDKIHLAAQKINLAPLVT
ncbi:dethiobiotin synthase [Colwellia sp. MT41]|uniref:ATP-dependent dethiobiotin synthetase BioD n=1 Tax=Colwellia marinimaniae TaxID=1513592 RepID=A0ABQ0MVP5_9GAMM|nr:MULTISPECIES: dethiobiotin synthase [Colwellia]ALO34846.1 dethiobiotin synthase [Colwellia sp. MT41]GAW96433.1 ATP-dependent dethiobiotin synthetase BioD [Colwellia marinimaniae]